ncbi:kinase-like domain-containing protein [Xylariomycetidae sp. FL2044]|nr:kinase-like domain-containing protein [Xylariomycetidae sp. FL2044]
MPVSGYFDTADHKPFRALLWDEGKWRQWQKNPAAEERIISDPPDTYYEIRLGRGSHTFGPEGCDPEIWDVNLPSYSWYSGKTGEATFELLFDSSSWRVDCKVAHDKDAPMICSNGLTTKGSLENISDDWVVGVQVSYSTFVLLISEKYSPGKRDAYKKAFEGYFKRQLWATCTAALGLTRYSFDEPPEIRESHTGSRADDDYIVPMQPQFRIGAGSYGSVYRCLRRKDGRVFALKTFRDKASYSAESERTLLARMQNKYIVFYQDSTIQGDLVMEYIPEGTLQSIRRRDPWASDDAGKTALGDMAWQMCIALQYIHGEFNLAHRDIHASNVREAPTASVL